MKMKGTWLQTNVLTKVYQQMEEQTFACDHVPFPSVKPTVIFCVYFLLYLRSAAATYKFQF